jgi:hypothetical protein
MTYNQQRLKYEYRLETHLANSFKHAHDSRLSNKNLPTDRDLLAIGESCVVNIMLDSEMWVRVWVQAGWEDFEKEGHSSLFGAWINDALRGLNKGG